MLMECAIDKVRFLSHETKNQPNYRSYKLLMKNLLKNFAFLLLLPSGVKLIIILMKQKEFKVPIDG